MKNSHQSSNKTLNMHYEVIDNNKSVSILLIHGFLGSNEIWNPLLMRLSQKFNLIRLDLPGHGKTTCLDETITMAEMADLVISIVEQTTLSKHSPLHIVGHSMGGYVGLELLQKKPNLFSSLTLLNSTAKADSDQKKEDRLRAVKVFDLSPKVYIKEAINNLFYEANLELIGNELSRLQEIALQTSPAGAKACLRGMRIRADYVEFINNTSIPIQYIAGVHDTTVTYESIKEQIYSPKIKLVSLQNSGHMSFAEERELCTDAIISFAEQI